MIFVKFNDKVNAFMQGKKQDYLDFFRIVGKSKRLPRTGWVREKVKNPESVAEHSFRVGVLAMVLSDKLGNNLDKEKLMKMALLHDLGEVITGDIVVERWDVIDLKKRGEQEKAERKGIKDIFDKLGADGEQYKKIYDEMIGRTTPEAKVFWLLDKLERTIQALEYEEEQGKNLEEFFVNFESYYAKGPVLEKIFWEMKKNRPRNRKIIV